HALYLGDSGLRLVRRLHREPARNRRRAGRRSTLCGRRTGPPVWLAGIMDHVLLGLVDRILAVRRPVPGTDLQGPNGARIYRWLRDRPGDRLFPVDDDPWCHDD